MSEPAASPDHAPRLFQLDGLRGLAALIIMAYHLQLVFHSPGPFGRGYLMVDLFYLLSGFVLAVSTEKKLNAGIGAFAFTKSRFVRLWPLVAVGAGVAVIRAFYIGNVDTITLLTWLALDLAMIPALSGSGAFYRLNGPQWTLFWEVIANFLHAALLRRVPTKWLPVIAAAFGVGLVLVVRQHGSDTMGVSALNWKNWYTPLPRVGWSYVMGVWMGRKYLEGSRGPSLPWQFALVLPIAAIMFVPYLPLSHANGDLLFVVPLLPLILWNVALCRPPQALAPAMVWLGMYSLPLYCVHLTVLVWTGETLGLSGWVQVLAVSLAFVLSWLFSKLISFQSKPTVVKPKTAALP
ncbi:MAG: acyltransferase [Novosphingobium sp.]